MDLAPTRQPLASLALECMRSEPNADQAFDLAVLLRTERFGSILPALARARWLLAQLTSATDPTLLAACVNEVASCSQWIVLLAEV